MLPGDIRQFGRYPGCMTTPAAPAPTLTIATDKASYAPGDMITLTATYADSTTASITVSVTASAVDAASNKVSANTSFQVVTSAPAPMTVTVTDDHNDLWTQQSASAGSVVFTTSAPSS